MDTTEGKKMIDDENNKRGLRPLVNRAYETRTKSAHTAKESTVTNTPISPLG